MFPNTEVGLESPEFGSKSPRKKLFSLIGLLILVIGVITSVYLVQNQTIFKSQAAGLLGAQEIQPQLIEETSLFEATIKDHPELFYADLEYNPATKLIVETGNGKTNGDPPVFSETPPIKLSFEDLSYRTDVVINNEIAQSGWSLVYSEIAQLSNGNLGFRTVVTYRPNSTIYLTSLEGDLLWSKIMD